MQECKKPLFSKSLSENDYGLHNLKRLGFNEVNKICEWINYLVIMQVVLLYHISVNEEFIACAGRSAAISSGWIIQQGSTFIQQFLKHFYNFFDCFKNLFWSLIPSCLFCI